ncbi:hypothetical protein KIV45_09240 [Janthinobacterium lividum]|nr:hypothetical protein KIV45_09240 [Janthinobacterium lividum]
MQNKLNVERKKSNPSSKRTSLCLLERAKVNELLTLSEVAELVERCSFVRTELLKADLAACFANATAICPSLKKS